MPFAPQTVSEEEISMLEECLLCARYGELDELREYPKSVVEKCSPDSGNSALMLASANGHKDVVVALLEWIPDSVNIQNKSGSTALHWAALNGHLEICSLLLEKGADCNIKNNFGERVFDQAVRLRADPSLCELLAKATNFDNDFEVEEILQDS